MSIQKSANPIQDLSMLTPVFPTNVMSQCEYRAVLWASVWSFGHQGKFELDVHSEKDIASYSKWDEKFSFFGEGSGNGVTPWIVNNKVKALLNGDLGRTQYFLNRRFVLEHWTEYGDSQRGVLFLRSKGSGLLYVAGGTGNSLPVLWNNRRVFATFRR
jgi:hypothetical protein